MSSTEKFLEVAGPMLEELQKMIERDPTSFLRFIEQASHGEVLIDCPELEQVARMLPDVRLKTQENGLMGDVLVDILQKHAEDLTPEDRAAIGQKTSIRCSSYFGNRKKYILI